MKRVVVLAGFAAMLVTAAACGGPTTGGQPTPQTTTGAGETSGAGQSTGSPATGGGSSLPVNSPCSLLSSSDLQQIGASTPPSQDMIGTAHSCEIDSSAFHFGLDIRTDVGLSGFSGVSTGGPITTVTIGHHSAKEQADTSSSSCTVAIGVSSSSRVDVSATGDGSTDPCPAARNTATLIESNLP